MEIAAQISCKFQLSLIFGLDLIKFTISSALSFFDKKISSLKLG